MNLHDVDKIIEIICKIENCEVEMIKSDKRNSELVYCRGIIILILRELFDLNYRQIGLFISRNKSTTYKLYKRFELMCENEKNLKIHYIKIINKLKREGLI